MLRTSIAPEFRSFIQQVQAMHRLQNGDIRHFEAGEWFTMPSCSFPASFQIQPPFHVDPILKDTDDDKDLVIQMPVMKKPEVWGKTAGSGGSNMGRAMNV